MSGAGNPPPPYPQPDATPPPGTYPPGYPAYPGTPGNAPYPGYATPYPGYPPQPGYPAYPPPAYQQPPDPADVKRYGPVGKPPWTLGQTLLGAGLTVVPWLVIVLGLQLASSSTNVGFTKRLPTAVDAISAVIVFVVSAIVEGAFLLAPLIIAVWRRPPGVTALDGLRALGFKRTPLLPAIGWVVLGIVLTFVTTAIYGLLIQHFDPSLQTNVQTLSNEAKYAPITVGATLLVAAFIAPFCEETFFRGFLFTGLLRSISLWPAVIVSALVFGVVHTDVGSFAPIVVLGLMLAFIRWRTGSIWPGMALHALNNGLAALLLLPLLLH